MRRLIPEVINLQSSYGGPIIAVQVENEYGMYYNSDQNHLRRGFFSLNHLMITILYQLYYMTHVIWRKTHMKTFEAGYEI